MKGKDKLQLFLEEENHTEVEQLSPIQQFYHGKNIFITGATGFVGKCVLEKFLRCCPGIGNIYIMMRAKRGKTAEERLKKLFSMELFDIVNKRTPDVRNKVYLIYGDLEQPGLGINSQDVEMLKANVDMVVHSAARVRWDDPLRLATIHHLVGTSSLLTLLKGFSKLKGLVYVSTSYVHRDPDLSVPEYVTKMKISPSQLLAALDWIDDEGMEALAPMLLKEKHNSYLFTKALTENLVVDERGDIPTAIVRPCSISPSYKDPFPGWGDTVQGIQGLVLAAAKGFLRTLYSYKGLKLNVVPVDIVVNCIVAAGWHIGTSRPQDIFVVNSVIDYDMLPEANEVLLKEVLSKRDKYPLANIYRYPDFTLYYTPILYYIHAAIDHYIPAIIGDTFLFIFTGKTLMIRLYKKIAFLFHVFASVGKEPWICKMVNYNALRDNMAKKDAELFGLDSSDLDWIKYIDDMLYGGRKLLAHEDPSNIPYAKRKAKVWWFVTSFLKWLLIFYFLYYLFNRFYTINTSYSTYIDRNPFSSNFK